MATHELPLATFAALEPGLYLQEYLKRNQRPDGTPLSAFRKTRIATGGITTADASVTVDIGETRVLCAVKAEITVPSETTPDQGFIVPNIDITPMAASFHRAGPPGEDAQAYAKLLSDLFEQNASFIDKKELCISEGNACWVLYVDIYCLNDTGNVLDAAILACSAALAQTALPSVIFDEEEGAVSYSESPERKRLRILDLPLAATFAVAEMHYLLADPRHDEQHSLGAFVVVLGQQKGKELIGFHQFSQYPIPLKHMQAILQGAELRFETLRALLDQKE